MAYTFKHGDRPLEGYTIQRAVGAGGFGEVYYAVSDGGREVALKYLKDNPQIELRGVSHCINLKSPHLVSIFDVKKSAAGDYFVIMEYCSGPSLRDMMIAEPNGFAPEKAAFFVREIGKGLAYLHDRGIVHRDLKPGNLFYDDGYVKIGDYGLSKFISISRHSAQTASIGTVHYMAPEIGSGNYSKGVDIYALGVMLYEMLLGRLPFDGSTMGEVLMKHLAAQPELGDLPAPFGEVVRKALEKDPNERYQSVDEMVEALTTADVVKESLAGFSAKSLEGAVRHGGTDQAPSPVPSPNPVPYGARGFGGARPNPAEFDLRADALPERLAKRFARISRKVDKKISKLAARGGKPAETPLPVPAAPPVPRMTGDRIRLMGLAGLLSVGLALGLGFLVANSSGDYRHIAADEVGIAAGLQVAFLSVAVLLAHAAIGWFRVSRGPSWARYMIRLVCAAPLLAIATFPLLGDRHGFPIWLGLLAVAAIAKWDKALDRSDDGEMSFWSAIWTGVGAMIAIGAAGAITDVNLEDLMFPAAAAAAATSLVIQASSWWLPSSRYRLAQAGKSRGDRATNEESMDRHQSNRAEMSLDGQQPFAVRVGGGDPRVQAPQTPAATFQRWGVTRAFWGIVAFAAFGGMAVTALIASLDHSLCYDEVTGVIIGSIACGAFMLYALRKTGPLKRRGFWQESLRPLLTTGALFGIGATTTGIARNFDRIPGDDQAGLIVGLTFCSMIFLVSLALGLRGRRPRTAPSFLIDDAAAKRVEASPEIIGQAVGDVATPDRRGGEVS